MLEFDISYSNGRKKVKGVDKVFFNTAKDMLEFVQQNLVVIAKEFLAKEQKDGEFPKKDYVTITDGKLNRQEELVRPLGKIEYVSKLDDITQVVLGVMRLVVERSPTRSGYYQSTNILLYNGKVVAKGIFETNAWLKVDRDYKPSDRFRIVNLAPYARKLERLGIKRGTRGKSSGMTSGKSRTGKSKKGAKILAPNGAYWLAKNTARRKFPQLKDNIKFSFIPVSPSIASSQNTKSFSPNSFKFSTGQGKGRSYLYPSISITINVNSFSENSGFTEDGGRL